MKIRKNLAIGILSLITLGSATVAVQTSRDNASLNRTIDDQKKELELQKVLDTHYRNPVRNLLQEIEASHPEIIKELWPKHRRPKIEMNSGELKG